MSALEKRISSKSEEMNFSGVAHLVQNGQLILHKAYGYANRSEKLENNIDTRFGIASGCKLFTAIAICQLVEQGKLTFHTKLKDCLSVPFPNFSEEITVHHLLTHSSGVPDYFDEEVMDDFEDIWKEIPMYLMKNTRDFLPLFQNGKMKFSPGERFHYNNTGFLLLGLVIEQLSGMSVTSYVEEHIFKRCNMDKSGYYSLDRLPNNTALGYIDEANGMWRTNLYSLPIIGGADGGAFITTSNMINLWQAVREHNLLSETMTGLLFTSHVQTGQGGCYGYGVWIEESTALGRKYHVMGYDPGVSFASAYYPERDCIVVITSNKSSGPHDILEVIEKEWK
ncbi:serine hydrolase domain-containing protein [Alkalihalobacillus hemicellulosilyticus]|uniref:Penicillin-binding protein n=1 Tax=Halalkalibacter hemicellulosilyticusJCM 9152 TaxID=1236971 RepID=W4QKN6_9BACI|nr:serine hydrolase [Halalkalibacter hemicellulosilyticus]GAE32208.1 penicillin-binding protein [Halalkalibacter hemicellulosilyticusJCM 9152]